MARVSRRTFVTISAVAVGVVVVSRSAAELMPNSSDRTAVLERLARDDQAIAQDLRDLGRAVNQQSPMSARRAGHLAEAEPEGPFAPILVVAGQTEPLREPVIIDGWLLPDLVAGVAGAAALESEQDR